MRQQLIFCFFVLLCGATVIAEDGQNTKVPQFRMHRIDSVRSEAVGVADFNNDGKPDIVAGEYIYLAPDWKRIKIREIPTNVDEQGKGYPHDFANLPMDVDEDGFIDIVAFDIFGKKAFWFRNPGKDLADGKLWESHLIAEGDEYESAGFWDVTGDGRADQIIPAIQRTLWFEKTAPGKFATHIVSDKWMAYGVGTGDINGDGRPDIVRPTAWFEAPIDIRNGTWKEHPLNLLGDDLEMRIRDASQIYVYDVNKDGLADIIAGAAHDYGLFWYEQFREGDEISWKKHVIDNSWSQVHAIAFADLDGCGEPEIITGKRFMAHNGNDRGEFEPIGVYWYKMKRNGNDVVWEKYVLTYDEGIGAAVRIIVVDMNGDGRPDIVTTGKYGGPVWFENLGCQE